MKRIVDMEIALPYIPLITWPEEMGMATRTLIGTAFGCIIGNLIIAAFFKDWATCFDRSCFQCVALTAVALNMWVST
jgi:hypothetical protein